MSELSAYAERQEDEVAFLQEVFPNPGDFQDLRKKDAWKINRPPEFLLTLVPQKSMGGSARQKRPVTISLHVMYTTDYPDSVPKLSLENQHGLTPDLVKELDQEIKDLARERRGEVMMLEIAQHVMSFLHKYDRPQVSLHQEMMLRQKEEESMRRRKMEAEEQKNRRREVEEMEEEMRRKTAALEDHEFNSDDEDSENSSGEELVSSSVEKTLPLSLHKSAQQLPAIYERPTATKVTQSPHKDKTKKIEFKRGKWLGDSPSRGYSVYVGMDVETGELLAVYEWNLQTTRSSVSKRRKQVLSILQEFESLTSQGLHHTRLLQHLDMTISPFEADCRISVELVMEYVGGGNLNRSLRNAELGPVPCSMLAIYGKQLLKGLDYLHSKGIVHNDIRPSAIYFEEMGSIKLGGSNIIRRLSDLCRSAGSKHPQVTTPTPDEEVDVGAWPVQTGDHKGGKKGDIFKLGVVMLCMATGKLEMTYPPSIPEDLPESLRDFLSKCIDVNEHLRLPAKELLHHPFILPSIPTTRSLTSTNNLYTTTALKQNAAAANEAKLEMMRFKRSDSIFGSSPIKPFLMGRSRLETEFEELEMIGSGGFGEVIKVRHHLDARVYAIKKVQIPSDTKTMNKITREVELLSQMNHENVVRYYNAWLETYTEEEFKKHTESGTFLDDDTDTEADQLSNLSAISPEEELSSDDESSTSDSDLSDSDSNAFHSATEDNLIEDEEDSFITFESSEINGRRSSPTVDFGQREIEEDSMFMQDFSDVSKEEEEGNNVLGKLEHQVMRLSISRFRHPTTESSDTVVFKDSSATALSKPVVIEKGRRSRDKRKSRSPGQIQILYIQMEYCENKTLRQLIDSDDLHTSEDKVWRLLREIAEGLEHIHSKGMIHRDLKPGNVFLNSSGHIKIGDFGLATSRKQHIHKNTAPMDHSMLLADGETGLVGTTMYLAPELFKSVKYTQKVDTYSLGIMFFEMCHAPLSTAMERHKILVELRKPDICFPSTFDPEKPQAQVIRLLLDHNPHKRPSATELLQNSLLPPKMEDEELQEVLLRTLQSTNSTRYHHLMNKLFAQEGFRVSEYSYFMDPQDNKRRSHHVVKNKFSFQALLLQQLVHGRLVAIFTRHGAVSLSPPLLSLRSSSLDSAAQLMDSSGTILTLPYDHRSPFARYLCHQDISYLKRYSIAPVFRESKVLGSHPREHYECQFDIVTPNPGSLVADAEIMYLVSEVIGEIPGLLEQQFCVWISHTALLSSILTHCSIDEEKHGNAAELLNKMMNGLLKPSDLLKKFNEVYNIQLSPLAYKTLLRFVQNVPNVTSPDEVQLLLEPLLRDKSAGIASQSSQAWQEIATIACLFREFGGKEQVYLHSGLTLNHQQFSGVIFQFVHASTHASLKKSKHSKRMPLALGGRYDKLLGSYRRPGQSGAQPKASVVGVTIMSDVLEAAAFSACAHDKYQASKCTVLVCWLGHESMQKECLQLVRDLWTQGISADLLYDSMEKDNMEEVQQFCLDYKIPHLAVLGDKALLINRKVKLKTFEGNKVIEKQVKFSELVEFLQLKHVPVERSDSTESKESTSLHRGGSQDNQSSGGVPKVNTTVVVNMRVNGHQKRRYHDQAVNKLHPLLQSFSTKQQLEVIVVDLKSDALCSLAAELNKMLGINDLDFSVIPKAVCERHSDASKKYISKICDSVLDILANKKKLGRPPVMFLYSHFAEFAQVLMNSLIPAS